MAFRHPDFRWLRVPAALLKLGLGEMSSELLTSARVLPARLQEAGFTFDYRTIGAALAVSSRADQQGECHSRAIRYRMLFRPNTGGSNIQSFWDR